MSRQVAGPRTHARPNSTPLQSRTIDPSPSGTPIERPSAPKPSLSSQPDFRLAIDFGTKFTSVAWARSNGSKNGISRIADFPDDPMPGTANTQVPTEIAYLVKQDAVYGQGLGEALEKVYGYEIRAQRERPDDDDDDDYDYEMVGHVTNVKLLLDKSSHVTHLRKALLSTLQTLKKAGVIKKNEEVISDLLVCYLQHTKEMLERDQGLNDSSKVEITFCVPVCWKPSANAMMSACLQAAMKKVNLGIDSCGFSNLFMVNEAEAAAMYTLTSTFHDFMSGDVFLLLDCGGGTTDIGVYEIGREHPFRLGKEVIPPTGIVCGSGDLNRQFREFAIEQLKSAGYPNKDEVPIEKMVDTWLMPKFENEVKRSFSLKPKTKNKSYPFPFMGLQGVAGNRRIRDNSFVLSFEDMQKIFMPSLKKIAELLKKQINEARQQVDKVVLAGGFGDSPALKDFLNDTITQINRDHQTNIKLSSPPQNMGAAGVATGALMRAQDKEHGPAKVPRQSIGIYHHVLYDPESYSEEVLAVDEEDWETSERDGKEYIMKTLKWIIKVGEGEFQPVHEFKWEDLHIFTSAATKSWEAEYMLFASDECKEDFFKRRHEKNWGKTAEIGKVKFELFALKEYMKMYIPRSKKDGPPRYEVEILIVMKLIDKHLDFTAYWPAQGPHLVTIKGNHEPFNLLSAFESGTA